MRCEGNCTCIKPEICRNNLSWKPFFNHFSKDANSNTRPTLSQQRMQSTSYQTWFLNLHLVSSSFCGLSWI